MSEVLNTAAAIVTPAAVVAPVTPAKRKAPAVKPAKAPAVSAAPQAPRYILRSYTPATGSAGKPGYVPPHGWPVKAQGGNSIRAYCYSVAKSLAKSHPAGFTAAQFASALAANATGSTFKQPSTGWGTSAKPNGAAHNHANWFVGAKQLWLVPVGFGKPVAK